MPEKKTCKKCRKKPIYSSK